jgi:molybdopterin-guanine dinucleotide biosynthesis protein B
MENNNRLLSNKRLLCKKPVLGFAAYSGTGKTTLLLKLLPLMKLQGLRVAMIKQTHHDFEIDIPGKDSYELRKAGADQMLFASGKRTALITENESAAEPQLSELIAQLDLDNIDLIMVEGFKHEAFDKIELYRSVVSEKLIFTDDESVVAVATDDCIDTGGLPLLNINVVEEVAGFINRWLFKRLTL